MSDKLRFALLGTGNIAKQHAKAIELAGGELVALCNHNLDHAVRFVTTLMTEIKSDHLLKDHDLNYTQVLLYSDLETMLDEVKFDVLYITTPHITHVRYALMAVRRGIHCIIEKPLDISLAQAKILYQEALKHKVFVSVIAQLRYLKASKRIKQSIEQQSFANNHFGKPILGQVSVLAWRDEAYYKSNDWRGTWKGEGGGVLVNQAVHEIDLLCYFLGKVKTVYGVWYNYNHPFIEVDDTAQAIVTFDSGASASILVSNSINPAQSSVVHIMGSSGHSLGIMTHKGIEANAGLQPSDYKPVNDVFTLVSDSQLKQYQEHDYDDIVQDSFAYWYFAEQIKEFIFAINQNKPELICNDLTSAMGCMQIFTGIYHSSKLNKVLSVEEIMDLDWPS